MWVCRVLNVSLNKEPMSVRILWKILSAAHMLAGCYLRFEAVSFVLFPGPSVHRGRRLFTADAMHGCGAPCGSQMAPVFLIKRKHVWFPKP